PEGAVPRSPLELLRTRVPQGPDGRRKRRPRRVGSSGELLRACAYLKRIACLRPQEAAGFECQRSVAGKAVPLTDDSKRSGGGQEHRLSCESAHPKPGKPPTFYSGSCNHSRRGDGAPGSPRAAAKAARAGASTASNRYGTFN